MLTLAIMYEQLGQKFMDPSIDHVLPALLKKAADTNAFIADSADKGLISVCTYCSE